MIGGANAVAAETTSRTELLTGYVQIQPAIADLAALSWVVNDAISLCCRKAAFTAICCVFQQDAVWVFFFPAFQDEHAFAQREIERASVLSSSTEYNPVRDGQIALSLKVFECDTMKYLIWPKQYHFVLLNVTMNGAFNTKPNKS